MRNWIVGGILAGLVLFFWSAFSWMVLPWHNATFNQFTNESAISEIIISNAPRSGIYLSPHMQEQEPQAETTTAQKPFLFASIQKEGMPAAMGWPMFMSLLTQIIAALLVSWLLSKTFNLSYLERVAFVVIFAIAATLITHVPYWTWFAFDTNYTLVSMADLVFSWFLAGLVLAAFNKPKLSRY